MTTKKYKPIAVSKSNTAQRKKPAKKVSKIKRQSSKIKRRNSGSKKSRSSKGFNYKLSPLKPKVIPKPLPETPRITKGKTLRQMMRHTVALFKHNANDVTIRKLRVTKTKSGMPAISAQMLTVSNSFPNRVPKPRECAIIGLNFDQLKINKQRKVLVSCNCESYVYTFEYANASYGAGRIIYSNGEKPVVTNPSMAPGLCKHLYALSEHIILKDL